MPPFTVSELVALAIRAHGSIPDAERWLHARHAVWKVTPASLLTDDEGAALVEAELRAILNRSGKPASPDY